MIAVVLGLMTFVIGYEIARDALLSSSPGATRVDPWMFLGVIVAAAIPLVFSHFELRAGQQANSPALIADAREFRAHVFTSGTVFAALAAQRFGVPIDRLAALIIVVAIAKTGWGLLVDGMRVLLDASLDASTLTKVSELIRADPAVAELRSLTGRNAGRFRFLEAEVALRLADLRKADAATRRIERRVRQAVPHLDRFLLHAEPVRRTHTLYAIPLANQEGELSPHFGEAPFFALVTVRTKDGAVEGHTVIPNPHLDVPKAKGIRVAEWLGAHKGDGVLLKDDLQGKGPSYVFSDAAVSMQRAAEDTLAGELARLTAAVARAGGETSNNADLWGVEADVGEAPARPS